MISRLHQWWQRFGSRASDLPPGPPRAPIPTAASAARDIPPDDALIAYLQSAPGTVEIDNLNVPSAALHEMRAAGIKLLVPLVSQGELIGLLKVGPRLSRQEYSADDRRLLNNLAAQAAPSLRVAQLVRQQQIDVQARERIEQELRVARLIQQTLLPKEAPSVDGWTINMFYQPARAVGGDFYDFVQFEDGRLGLIIGDVTDKGVPAALVMATTRSVLRTAATATATPGQVLERVNDLLCADMPPNMFVTCFYAILDPVTGYVCYANAGHMLPFRRSATGVNEFRASGLPLGLIRGMRYEERAAQLFPGDTVLFYSDGLVEAHNDRRELFGFPRLTSLMQQHDGDGALIDFLLGALPPFTGPNWEQEDDITLMTLHRSVPSTAPPGSDVRAATPDADDWHTIADFNIASLPGNERIAVDHIAATLQQSALPWSIDGARLERLKTALAEATMNAIEHGNQNRIEVPVTLRLRMSSAALVAEITDRGGAPATLDVEMPNIEAKLAGLQTTRGWGLFLINNLVDNVRTISDGTLHTLELTLYREGVSRGS